METCGVEIDEYAVVSTGSVVLPGVHIGRDALIGAASVVTRDVQAETVAFGNPAKPRGSVREIKNKKGNSAYPWPLNFSRGMPWDGIGYEIWENRI